MFPPSNINNLFDYSSFKRPSLPSDQNPSSTLLQDQDPPFLFTNFPSPFFDEHESPLNQILLQNQPHQTIYHNKTEDPPKNNSKKFNHGPSSKSDAKETHHLMSSASLRRRNQLGVVPRRRTGKKDRHSKICTAQGIRDRRMRLSLQVARKFFDLQDILGYDKASKTIEWLFTQSKKAINELKDSNVSNTSDAKSESTFVSECEVVSGNDEISALIAPAEDEKTVLPFIQGDIPGERSKSIREEARDKARARARCRAREKVMMKTLQFSGQWCKSNPSVDVDLDQKLGFSTNPFGDGDNQEIRVSPTGSDVYEPQLADVGTIEKLLGDSICPTTTSSSAASTAVVTSINLDPSSSFMGFLENWEILPTGNPNYTIYSTTPKFQGFHQ